VEKEKRKKKIKNGITNGALPPHFVSLPLKNSYAVFYDEG
jgi:hypothetical protein